MREQKITLGEMRQSGVTGPLIYCSDYRWSHNLKIGAERWPDEVRLSDLRAMVCKACARELMQFWAYKIGQMRSPSRLKLADAL